MNGTRGNLRVGDLLQGSVGVLSITGCLLFKEQDSQNHCLYYWEEWQFIEASDADIRAGVDHDPGEALFYEPARLQKMTEPWALTAGQTMPLTINGVLHRGMVEEATTGTLENIIGSSVCPLNIDETMTYAEVRLMDSAGATSRLTIDNHRFHDPLVYRKTSLSTVQQKQLFGCVLYNHRSAPGRTGRNIGCAIVAALVSIVLVGGLFSACSDPGRSSGDADPTGTSYSGPSRSYRHHPVYGGGGGGAGKQVRPIGGGLPTMRCQRRESKDGDLNPFVGCLPRCYRVHVSAVSLCSVSYKISGAEPYALNNLSIVESTLLGVVQTAGLTTVSNAHHRFEPQGLSAVIILSESHIAIHTWPESGTGYVTLTSCRILTPVQIEAVEELVCRRLRAQQVTSSEITL